jgi:predicted Zn finger-like uncharacterized protein
LIITCAECATQFQLEEARVPESGIRVRCSVCKHAFFVAHPDALDDEGFDPVARVVRDVLDADAGEVPEATTDLEIRDGSAGPTGSAALGDEESWQWSDEGPPSDSASCDPRDRFEESFEAARDAVDSLLGSPWSAKEAASTSRSVGAEDDASEAWAPSAETDPPAADEAAVSAVRSDDAWEAPAWPEEEEEASVGQGSDEAASQGLGSPSSEPSSPLDEDLRASEAAAEFDLGPATVDDLEVADEGLEVFDELEVAGEGARFDDTALGEALEGFESAPELDSDPFEQELSSPAGSSDLATPEDWGLDSVSEDASLEHDELRAPAGSAAAITAPLPIGFGPALEREPRGGKVLAWLVRTGNTLGWGVVALLAAVTLWGSVAPRSVATGAPGAQALAGLEATGVAGRWVENATLGSLYVVSGELHNPGSETKAPGAKLVVRLLDAQGEPVEAGGASLGLPLDARLLREGRAAELVAVGEAGALELARTALAPGARIAFEAAVLDLPDGASRFDLTTAAR